MVEFRFTSPSYAVGRLEAVSHHKGKRGRPEPPPAPRGGCWYLMQGATYTRGQSVMWTQFIVMPVDGVANACKKRTLKHNVTDVYTRREWNLDVASSWRNQRWVENYDDTKPVVYDWGRNMLKYDSNLIQSVTFSNICEKLTDCLFVIWFTKRQTAIAAATSIKCLQWARAG